MIENYQNPILRGMYPDPSIVLVEDTYYMVNSTFEYYPGISLSKSTDLLNWTKVPSIVTKKNKQIYRKQNRMKASSLSVFVLSIIIFMSLQQISRSSKILSSKVSLNDQGEIIWENQRIEIDIMGIDPDLYHEEDRTYVTFTALLMIRVQGDPTSRKSIFLLEKFPARTRK